MKKFAVLALLLSLGSFTFGCNKTEKKAAPPMEGAAPAADAPAGDAATPAADAPK
jgi:hypothetical protein